MGKIHAAVSALRNASICYKGVVLGDTDDTSIYRDTKISRYWYRACLDTFWYRDTKSIAILFDTFIDTTQVAKPLIRCFGNFVTLMINVTLACMYQCVFILYLVQTISLIKLKLSIIITVEIFYAFYTCGKKTRMMGPYCRIYFSYGLERFICIWSEI